MQATLNNSFDVATAKDGTIFIVDRVSHSLRMVSPSGILTTLIGWAGTRPPHDSFFLTFSGCVMGSSQTHRL